MKSAVLTVTFLILGLSSNYYPNFSCSAQLTSEIIENDNLANIWTEEGGPYTLTGPAFIDLDETLVIDSGVTVNLNGHIIQVEGKLQAQGSITNPINFLGPGKILFTGESEGWNEQKQKGCIIENSNLIQCKIEIQDASPKIKNNVFKRGSIAVIGSNPHIGGGSPFINRNTVLGTSSYGIGISISGNNNATISENLVSGWSEGIATGSLFYATASFPLIERNLITNNTIGIKINLLIKDWVGNNFPVIQHNRFSKNYIGVNVICDWQVEGNSDSYTVPTIISQNNFQDNNYRNINGSCIIEAPQNWWGTLSPSGIAATLAARYKYIPFLTSPDSIAPNQSHNPGLTQELASAKPNSIEPYLTSTIIHSSSPFSQPPILQENDKQSKTMNSSPTTVIVAIITSFIAIIAALMIRKICLKKR